MHLLGKPVVSQNVSFLHLSATSPNRKSTTRIADNLVSHLLVQAALGGTLAHFLHNFSILENQSIEDKMSMFIKIRRSDLEITLWLLWYVGY